MEDGGKVPEIWLVTKCVTAELLLAAAAAASRQGVILIHQMQYLLNFAASKFQWTPELNLTSSQLNNKFTFKQWSSQARERSNSPARL